MSHLISTEDPRDEIAEYDEVEPTTVEDEFGNYDAYARSLSNDPQKYNCVTRPGVCDDGHIESCLEWNEKYPVQREFDKTMTREHYKTIENRD